MWLTANLQVSNKWAWQQKHCWACAGWLWTELEAEQLNSRADRTLTQRWASVWPWRSVLSQGESQGANDWLPFPATALLLNWAGLLDLSECTRLPAPRRHLLKQRRDNWWESRRCCVQTQIERIEEAALGLRRAVVTKTQRDWRKTTLTFPL